MLAQESGTVPLLPRVTLYELQEVVLRRRRERRQGQLGDIFNGARLTVFQAVWSLRVLRSTHAQLAVDSSLKPTAPVALPAATPISSAMSLFLQREDSNPTMQDRLV